MKIPLPLKNNSIYKIGDLLKSYIDIIRFQYDHIFLITHSMGGLVAKSLPSRGGSAT